MRIIFTNPSARAGYDTRSFFKRSLTGLNSEFSFSKTSCLTKAEEPSLPYYLLIAGGIIGFIPFPRVLVLCEMQSVRSRIWTRVAVSISCDDNHYTTGTIYAYKEDLALNNLEWLIYHKALPNQIAYILFIYIYIYIYMGVCVCVCVCVKSIWH